MTNEERAQVRREALTEAIDALDFVDAATLTGSPAEIRATLVEMLRDLGRIAPSWNPKQYDEPAK